MSATVSNQWGTQVFRPARLEVAESVEAVAEAVARARAEGLRVKPVGGGHSFNGNIRTEGVSLDIGRLNRVGPIDPVSGLVEAEAGATIGDVIVAAAAQGLAFPTLGSWHSQTLAGAIATSTHGSSLTHGSLSDLVEWVEAVLPNGTVARIDGGDDLRAFRCHLGQLGVVTRVALRLAPAFHLRCDHDRMAAPEGFDALIERARAAEYLNMLWVPYADLCLFRTLTRVDAEGRNAKARMLERAFTQRSRLGHTLEDLRNFAFGHLFLRAPRMLTKAYTRAVAETFAEDDGVIDASQRVFLYDQYREPTENRRLRMILNVEHALPLDRAAGALKAMRTILTDAFARGQAINYPRVNVRFAPCSDRTLVGLNADRDTAFIGLYIVASIAHGPQVPLARALEQAMVAHGGRPHWGKYSYLDGATAAEHPGMEAFRAIRDRLDPTGVFRDGANPFVGLSTFWLGSSGKLRSLVAADTYRPIRLL